MLKIQLGWKPHCWTNEGICGAESMHWGRVRGGCWDGRAVDALGGLEGEIGPWWGGSRGSGTKPGPGCLASILSLWGSLLTVAVVWSLSPIRQEAALVFAQS